MTSYGIHIKRFEITGGQIFQKKNLVRKKIFWTPLTEKTGKKTSKMAKNSVFEA